VYGFWWTKKIMVVEALDASRPRVFGRYAVARYEGTTISRDVPAPDDNLSGHFPG
jgi:hypothetical protein